MLFLASSMSHVEAAVVQVAYRNAKYLWPGFAGTDTKQIGAFIIKVHESTTEVH